MSNKKVLIAGQKDSPIDVLLSKIFDGAEFEKIYKSTIDDVFREVGINSSLRGIVPIESMLDGSIRETMFCLKNYNIIINESFNYPSKSPIRYLIIAKKSKRAHFSSKCQTSLIITPHEDRAGLLFEILSLFKIKNINLTKIESIPTGKALGEYIFYMEIDASMLDPQTLQAINFLKSIVDVKICGCYEVKDIE